METFEEARPLTDDPAYDTERQIAQAGLRAAMGDGSIDPPLIGLLWEFSLVPHCFTLQSCYGHFVHERQPELHNLEPLADYADTLSDVLYRIAYLAVCIRKSEAGRALQRDLRSVAAIDPPYIQHGSAGWFWEQRINTYVLQVEPARCRLQDTCPVGISEALRLEQIRDRFFHELLMIARRHRSREG
ncbi:hypothetical protein FGU65_01895 [Methanoculleus sp. FWC-SCC1]|uniref:Uncharacterized protein n=1 Tax=Methanoculleus frigidifontis TaxID=2584085 RepID=A0ABT8M6W2_9EURY|nr:hypothetical protein [Methanoculleus sp. FWC-SCC1]MDN7023661.1 hypothetical protein [Methanoculleus sp. FWC-SCC1]